MNKENIVKIVMILACVIIAFTCASISKAEITLISPAPGEFDNEIVNFKVVSDGNYSSHQIVYSNDPTHPEELYNFAGQFLSEEKDINTWPEGNYIVVARAYNTDSNTWDWSNNISMNVKHKVENIPALKIVGISPGMRITDNKTKLISIVDNQTGNPVEGATIYIMADATSLCNSYQTTISGKSKIEWIDIDGNRLQNDIYFVRIEKNGYATLEYDIEIDIKVEEIEKPELEIWGLDRKYNADISSSEIVRIKGSDSNDYLEDVVVKIVSAKGIPVSHTMISNTYGTIDFSIAGIQQGSYSVVFEHPDYDTKIIDIEITKTPTPVPTPTPTERPFFEWNGKKIYTPYTVTLQDGSSKSYMAAAEFSKDFQYINGETIEISKEPVESYTITKSHPDTTRAGPSPIVYVVIALIVTAVGIYKLYPEKLKKNSIEFIPDSNGGVELDFSESVVNESDTNSNQDIDHDKKE